MKHIIIILDIFMCLSGVVAQPVPSQQHTAILQWNDNINPPGTLYNVYRATSVCGGTPTFTKIATMLGSLNYQDKTITSGTYCYTVTAVANSGESPRSNTIQISLISAPTGLTVVVQE